MQNFKYLLKRFKVVITLLFLSASMNQITAQQSVSLSFTSGYMGVQGTNTNQANSIKKLSTLGIVRASFSQVDVNGDGLFGDGGGTQGNDLAGKITLYLSNGTVKTLNGALNWRETTGSKVEVFGFIFDAGQNTTITYTGGTYNIVGGSTKNTSTTLGLKAYASTWTFTDGENRSGNAATSGLLDALNTELRNTPQPSSISLTNNSVTEGQNLVFKVTLSSTTTSTQVYTFSVGGTSTKTADYSATYTFSNGVVNNGDGTLTIPSGVSNFTVTVNTIDDAIIESTETFILNVGSKSATGNILDNDAAITSITYGTPNVYIVGNAITSLKPTIVGGAPSSYTIAPSLPAGLTLDPNTGYISGTPTATSTQTTYVVTGTNANGSVNSNNVLITVKGEEAIIKITYPSTNVYTVGLAIPDLKPTVEGGTPTCYSLVTGTLPSGLSLDPATGIISGTPTAIYPKAGLVVAGANGINSVNSNTFDVTVNNIPQGSLDLVYNTLLAADTVKAKITFTSGVAPFKVIIGNDNNNVRDTISNITPASGLNYAIVKLKPQKDSTIYNLISIEDVNATSRTSGFTKDTANLNILKPLILLTLKADVPVKQTNNGYKTKLLMKIKNAGELDLSGVQVDANLSNVFPKDMKYTLDSTRVTYGNLKLNPNYTGIGTTTTNAIKNTFTTGVKSNATLNASDLFDNGVNLTINEEGDVTFYFTIDPTTSTTPLKLQFNSSGNGVLTQADGTSSTQATTSLSHDGSALSSHPSVTNVGSPLPTYVPLFPVDILGASFDVSASEIVTGGFLFHYTAKVKNLGNSTADSIKIKFDLDSTFLSPDNGTISNLKAAPKVTYGIATLNDNYDGINDKQLLKLPSTIGVKDSIVLDFDVLVATSKLKATWPTNLYVSGVSNGSGLAITDTSTNGLYPDPNSDNNPIEMIKTIASIGYERPAAPKVTNATYTINESTNPKDIKKLAELPTGTLPVWCDVNGNNCLFTPPTLPTKVGVYVWCVKSLDTLTNFTSEPCVYDTVTILPTLTLKNATYVNGVITNPKDIKLLITSITPGSVPVWYDVTGANGTKTAPSLPAKAGTYYWGVRAQDTLTSLLSATLFKDTVNILDPYTVMEISKQAREVKLNPDGSIMVSFVMKASNKTDAVMDSVTITDDLSKTFNATTGITVYSLETYGGLVKNSGYDGIANIDLVAKSSKIASKTTDSLLLKVKLESTSIVGSYLNTAILSGKTKYGRVTVSSNDPTVNANDSTKRSPTPFIIPKVDLVIAGGFSPNQDGLNDKWIIIRPFGTRVEVQVFNRWGNIVYQNADYKNDWTGKGESNFMGEDVPDGTYFYIVNAIDPTGAIKKFTSSLTIVR